MRIVFDITTSVFWAAPAVGIVRVERNIAKALLKREDLNSKLIFVFYDRPSKQFFEVPHNEAIVQLSEPKKIDGKPESPPHSAPSNKYLSLGEKGRLLVSGIEKIWDGLFKFKRKSSKNNLIIKLWNYLGELANSYSKRHEAKKGREKLNALQATSKWNPIELSEEDIYLSFGLDWEYKDLTEIWRQKQKQKFKTLLCCYDVIFYTHPQFVVPGYDLLLTRYMSNLLWAADHVMSISEHSKQDLERFARNGEICAAPKVKAIHLAYEFSGVSPDAKFEHKEQLAKKRFLFTVGTIEPRKNIDLLYRLWQKLAQDRYEDIPLLVIAGNMGWNTGELVSTIKNDPILREKIIILNGLSDDDLAWLYEHCYFFVYPSYYEGFGLPLAECMLHKKFALSSNTSSLPEVAKGLVDLLDPFDFYAWYNSIKYYLEDPKALKEKEDIISKSFKGRSWDQVADDIINFLPSGN